jgi:hypothetical protein
MMLYPRWSCEREQGRFATWLAAIGRFDASVLHIGERRWNWLISRDGRDIAEGVEGSLTDAKHAALTAVLVRRR